MNENFRRDPNGDQFIDTNDKNEKSIETEEGIDQKEMEMSSTSWWGNWIQSAKEKVCLIFLR